MMRMERWCEMGRDIHVVLEKKTAAGWEFFDPGFECFDERYYPFFELIEGIIDPGCPDELNHQQLRCQMEQWTDQKQYVCLKHNAIIDNGSEYYCASGERRWEERK